MFHLVFYTCRGTICVRARWRINQRDLFRPCKQSDLRASLLSARGWPDLVKCRLMIAWLCANWRCPPASRTLIGARRSNKFTFDYLAKVRKREKKKENLSLPWYKNLSIFTHQARKWKLMTILKNTDVALTRRKWCDSHFLIRHRYVPREALESEIYNQDGFIYLLRW